MVKKIQHLRFFKLSLIIFSCILIILAAIFGTKFYINYKEILSEKQKLVEEVIKYNASNFSDREYNYVKIFPEKKVNPGGLIDYEIAYKNDGLVDVKDFEVEIKIPLNCEIQKERLTGTYQLKNNMLVFPIGKLSINKGGEIKVTLKVDSPLDNGTIIYPPEIRFKYFKRAPIFESYIFFNKDLDVNSELAVESSPEFGSSTFTLEGSDNSELKEVTYGDDLTYKLSVYNSGTMNASDVVITIGDLNNLVIPEDKNKEFKIEDKKAVLKIAKINAGEKRTFFLYTQLNNSAPNDYIIAPKMEITYGKHTLQKESQKSIVKLYPAFNKSVVLLKIRGGNDADSTAYAGDIIDAKINIKNSGDIAANNLIVKLVLSNLFSLNEGMLTWQIPELKVGQEIVFDTSLKIVGDLTKNSYAKCYLNISSDELNSYKTSVFSIAVTAEKPFTRNYIPIIALHEIEMNLANPIEISVGAFDALCGTLKANGFKTITFMDLLNYLDNGKKLPEKPVIITSDDGYQDNYTYAFPILKKYGLKMTVFLVTGLIGNSEAERRNNEFDAGRPNIAVRPMLIWPEVIEMSKYGCEFLSHTVNHVRLGYVSTDVALYELSKSKSDIESHTGKPVLFFAWPYDNFSGKILGLISQAGYRGSVSYVGGIENVRTINILNIKRIPLNSFTVPSDYVKYFELQK